MAEEEGGVVPEGPVVVEGVDGSGQWLQDAVHDTGDQAAHVRAQVQVGVLDQTLDHVEESVELLQVVTHRLYLETAVPQMSPGIKVIAVKPSSLYLTKERLHFIGLSKPQ